MKANPLRKTPPGHKTKPLPRGPQASSTEGEEV